MGNPSGYLPQISTFLLFFVTPKRRITFLTSVRPNHSSATKKNSFYWFFPAIKPKVKDPPLIIWLQGGPGSSSMIGLFFENGPIRVTDNMKLARRPTSWADEYSVLFIDQPVGTGYSYVTKRDNETDQVITDKATLHGLFAMMEAELHHDQAAEEVFFAAQGDKSLEFKSEASRKEKIRLESPLYSHGYVKDERGVAADLINFMSQFYDRYPEQQKVDLFLSGESYAGKYVPAFAHAIMEHNLDVANSQDQYPLKGIALGNTLTDPVSQVQIHADHAYFLGLVNRKQADKMRDYQDKAVEEAEKGRFLASNGHRISVFDAFKNATGGLNWYDIRKGSTPNDWTQMEKFMNLNAVKDSLNVFGPRASFLKEHSISEQEIAKIEEGRAATKYFKDPIVMKTMGGDIMRSASWMVSDLLGYGVRVLAFQGIFDFRDAVAGSNIWIEELEWSGKRDFEDADRELWIINKNLAGFVTSVPGLTRVTVLGAGHLAPMDQAEAILVMMRNLIEGTDFETESPTSNHTAHTI
ncbi:MAG: Alpha/Beta hydrolase protein [Podila humilis]|nr:MAG: Alpha/Beta hydrolase protein [Podila humilis]